MTALRLPSGRLPRLAIATLVTGSVTMSADATPIFRSIDADGYVVYADTPAAGHQPRPSRPSSQPQSVEPAPTNSMLPVRAASPRDPDPIDHREPTLARVSGYPLIAISLPAAGATVRNNAGNVTVVPTLRPALGPGHRLQLIMDQRIVATIPPGQRFHLRALDRGTHELTVRVIDAQGAELASSQPSTFHLQRAARR